jgi:hypothetical protein
MQLKVRCFLLTSTIILGVLGLSTSTLAETLTHIPETSDRISTIEKLDENLETPTSESTDDDSQEQVTSVSQLSDVKPTDWAFKSLQSLIEKYGCISLYPNHTFQGNRSLTRYEFAAALNACLNQINELALSKAANKVRKEDLTTIEQLKDQFVTELASLRSRMDAVEARTPILEQQQFSTTTKLTGNVLFSLVTVGPGTRADGSGLPISSNTVVNDFVRLNFDTSFTGTDLLRTRLEASNIQELENATGTNMGRLLLDGDSGNQFDIALLSYQFKLGDKFTVHVGVRDEIHEMMDEDVDAIAPVGDHVNGAISRFGQFNPIFHLGGEDVAGGSLTYEFSHAVRFALAYVAGVYRNDPNVGLFGGSYVALAQLTLHPIEHLSIGLTYANSYSPSSDDNALDTGTGSLNANNPFGDTPTSANTYGLGLSYQVSPKFIIAPAVGYTTAHAEAGADQGANADIFDWYLALAFPDLAKAGSLGGIVIGQPPKVTRNDIAGLADPGTALQLEVFYRYPVSDYIAITPGVIIVQNPENNNNNDTVYIGTIRTTFSF